MFNPGHLKKYACIIILCVLIFNVASNHVYSQQPNGIIKETLRIDQIYNNSIVTVSISSSELQNLINSLAINASFINSYTVIVANINLNNQTLSWFLTNNPEKLYTDFIFEKGFVITINYTSSGMKYINETLNALNLELRTNLVYVENKNNYFVYTSPAFYQSYLSLFLNKLNYNYGGFFNLTNHIKPSLFIYNYNSKGFQNLTLISFLQTVNASKILTQQYFLINYTKYLGIIDSSKFATSSRIILNLYGMIANYSSPKIKFVSFYSDGFITKGEVYLQPGETLDDFYVNASFINPFITVQQIPKPAITNSSFNMIVKLYNLGSIEARNVTVKLFTPPNFIGSRTLIFNSIKPNSSSEQTLSFIINGSVPKVYYLSPPIAYLNIGETNITFVGNPVYVAYKLNHFSSLSFSIPYVDSSFLKNTIASVLMKVNITNTGDIAANNITLSIDHFTSKLSTLNSSSSYVLNLNIQLSNLKELPNGSLLFNSLVLSYYSNNVLYQLNASNLLFSSLLNYEYTSYASVSPYPTNSIINNTIDLILLYNVYGGDGNVTINIPKQLVQSQNLTILSPTNFKLLNNSYSYALVTHAGSRSSIRLELSVNNKNIFFITPIYEKISYLNDKILIPASIFSNAVSFQELLNSTQIQLGNSVSLLIKVINFGQYPVYDVRLNISLYKGWNLIDGLSNYTVGNLLPNQTISYKIIVNATKPTSPYIPPLSIQYSIGNLNFTQQTHELFLKISMSVNFIATNIFNGQLNNFNLIIYSINNTLLNNITTSNGIASWNGYIGIFNVSVIYKGVVVYQNKLNVTAYNSTIYFKSNVTLIQLTITDIFGDVIHNANVNIFGTTKEAAILSNSTYYFLNNLPFGNYTVQISINGKYYIIPIKIDSYTPLKIKLVVPVINLFGFILSVQLVAGIFIILIFLLLVIFFVRLNLTRKFSAAPRK